MASTPGIKSHRARVTYGRSAGKQARNGESNNRPNYTSSPSTPSIQPNGNRAGDAGPSTKLPNRSNSPTAEQDEQSARGYGLERRAIRQRGGSHQPSSLKSPTSIMESRASSRHSRHTNVYDVPSSGDEKSAVYGSGRKRRKTGILARERESPPVPVTPPQRKQQPVSRKPEPTSKGQDLQSDITTSNGDVNVPARSRIEVVIGKDERRSSGKQGRPISLAVGGDSEGISFETTAQPGLSPNLKTTEQYKMGQQPGPKELVKRRSTPKRFQAGNGRAEYMRSKTPDDIPIAVSPGRRRLVDGLNMSGSDVDDSLNSVIVNPQESDPLSPSHSKSSLDLSNSKGIGPSESRTGDGDVIQRPTSTQNSQTIGPRITYARQRSFLSETSMLQDPDPVKASDPLGTPQKYGVRDNDGISSMATKMTPVGIDDESGITSSGAVRSIHELRQAGGNARFQGMVDSILEDIEDNLSPVSGRRSGLIQLCCKLGDYDFARQFLENGAEKRLSRSLRNQVDIISSCLSIYACALLLSTGPISNTTLSACCSVISDVTPLLLGEEEDIQVLSKSRRMNSSRAEQASLRDLRGQSLGSRIWPDKSPTRVTPQIMTLRCLEMVVRKVREKGEHLEIISGSALDQLVEILLRHSNNLKANPALANDFLVLELVFSILESYTVEMSSLGPGQETTIKQLSRVGPFLSFLTEQDNVQSQQLQILNIRLILNVTNNNLSLCEDFATSDIIGALVEIILSKFGLVSEDSIGERREPILDTVILALGTLINLTEWSETPRTLILSCEKNSVTFIDSLLRLFTNGLDMISEV